MNSKKFIQVRQTMLEGKRPIECEGCWRDEDSGIESKRQYENKRWAHVTDKLEKTAFIKNPNYRYVELRLGNICNNACITCNSYSSSKWYPDEKKISKQLPWFSLRPMENFKWFENPDFYNELTKYSQDVEEIYINGGEPTLIKAHYLYLQNLINNNTAQKVHLVYSLNMMDIPDSLIKLWESFNKVTVNASIDDFKERNYYIRYPTQWEQTVASIEKLNKISNVYWHVTQTVSLLNISRLDILGDWLYSNYGKIPHHNYVLYPDYLSVEALPNSYKDRIREYYTDKLTEHQRIELFAKLQIDFNPECLKKASEFIRAVDNARNLNFQDYIPELSEIL
jgi:MoaA/NifB/PqqE/SkfB family radical SAM enzyme